MKPYAIWLSELQPAPIKVWANSEEEAVEEAIYTVERDYPGFFQNTYKRTLFPGYPKITRLDGKIVRLPKK